MKKTKQILSVFLSLCIIVSCMVGFSITAGATISDSGTCGTNLTWIYEMDNNETLTISGTGAMFNSEYGWENYRNQIKNIVIGSGVTSIGDSAFQNFTQITNVTIPSGVTRIGAFTFVGCTALASINIPSGVTIIETGSFSGCTSLTSITIPNSITKIWGNAFEGCTSLTSIIIPASVTSLAATAFKDCTSLTSITFEGTEEQWAALAASANIPVSCTVTNQGYTYFPAVAATCTTAGKKAYYSKDNKKYTKTGVTFTEVTNESTLTTAALGHDLTNHAAVAATCTTAGNSAYKYCSRCKNYFDADGNEIAKNSWVIPASHTLTAHAAVAKTCTEAGNSAYWECTACHNYFSDANGATQIEADSWVIPAGHTLTHVAAKAATCTASGVKPHYKCTVCGKLFTDNDGTKETTLAAMTTAALAHSYENGKCTRCGEADPDYIEPAEPEPDPTPTPYISPYIPTPSPSITPASTTPSTAAASDTAAGVTNAGTANNNTVSTGTNGSAVTNTNVKKAVISLKKKSISMKLGQIAKINIKKLVVIDNLAGSKDVKIKVSVPKGLKYTLKDGKLTVTGARKGTYRIYVTVTIEGNGGKMAKKLPLKIIIK